MFDETVSLFFTIRNIGGKPVQILSLLVEELREDKFNVSQIAPDDLPVVLEPGTTTEITLQKEHLDLLESCTFLGAIDGVGRRHAIPTRQAKAIIEESWRLPTRVAVYHRRDDPDKRVVAFRLAEHAKMTQRTAKPRLYRQPQIIAKRTRPLIEALLSGDQPRVSAPIGDDHS